MVIKKILQRTNILSGSLDAELILAYVTKKSREYIIAHPEHKLTSKQISKFKFLISKRLKGWSVATLIGEKEFYGLKFKVSKNVLIPRPETEMMVDEALRQITNNNFTTIIDVGTGSGCVIITLANLFNQQFKKKCRDALQCVSTKCKFYAIDISKSALQVARNNARLHKVDKNIKFLHGNLLNPIIGNWKLEIGNSKILILANLPYLTKSQIKNSPSIQKEPLLALDGGRDGLKYYQQLFEQIAKLKTLYPKIKITTICEIDPGQKEMIKKIAGRLLGPANIEIKKDLQKNYRITIIN